MKLKNCTNIFEYEKYSLFLSDFCQNQGHGAKGRIAKALGIKPSYLSRVLAGECDISLEQAESMSRYLEFTKEELRYLISLVQESRASTPALKSVFKYERRRQKDENFNVSARFQSQSFEQEIEDFYYSHWSHLLMHILGTLEKPLKQSEILFHLKALEPRAEKSLKKMINFGLLRERADGKIVSADYIRMLDRKSKNLWNLHKNLRSMSLSLLDREQAEDLAYSSIVSVSKEDVEGLKTELRKLLSKANERIKESTGREKVFLFNLDFLEAVSFA